MTIYAVRLNAHPDAIKIGMTTKWNLRRRLCAEWNLCPGDGIADERVYTISDEYADLGKVEAHLIELMPFPVYRRKEWFVATLDDVCDFIERELINADISFVSD